MSAPANPDATAAHWAALWCGFRARQWDRASLLTAQTQLGALRLARALQIASNHASARACVWRGYEAHNRDEMVRVMGGAPRSIR